MGRKRPYRVTYRYDTLRDGTPGSAFANSYADLADVRALLDSFAGTAQGNGYAVDVLVEHRTDGGGYVQIDPDYNSHGGRTSPELDAILARRSELAEIEADIAGWQDAKRHAERRVAEADRGLDAAIDRKIAWLRTHGQA